MGTINSSIGKQMAYSSRLQQVNMINMVTMIVNVCYSLLQVLLVEKLLMDLVFIRLQQPRILVLPLPFHKGILLVFYVYLKLFRTNDSLMSAFQNTLTVPYEELEVSSNFKITIIKVVDRRLPTTSVLTTC